MTLMKSMALRRAPALAFALPARAAETAEQELRALDQCGAGLADYQRALSREESGDVTQADRDLADRFGRLEPRVGRGKPERIDHGGRTVDSHNGADQAMAEGTMIDCAPMWTRYDAALGAGKA